MTIIRKVEDAAASTVNAILGDDIFSQLKTEHDLVKSLLKKAQEAAPGERAELLEQIEEELVPHARGEEKTIYSVLHTRSSSAPRKQEELLNLTNEAYEEHRAVDELLADLKVTDVNDERWRAKLTVIKENLEHHIKEEENELFKQAKTVLKRGEAEELLEAYLEAKKTYMQSLPPQSRIRERQASPSASKLL